MRRLVILCLALPPMAFGIGPIDPVSAAPFESGALETYVVVYERDAESSALF